MLFKVRRPTTNMFLPSANPDKRIFKGKALLIDLGCHVSWLIMSLFTGRFIQLLLLLKLHNTVSPGFQCWLNFQEFIFSVPGLDCWEIQPCGWSNLLVSLLPQGKIDIVWLPEPNCIRQSNKLPFNIYTFYQSCSPKEHSLIEKVTLLL